MSTSAREAPHEIHHAHRDVTGGWLRPAVFGVMDGLVSNISLLSGVAGGHASTHTLLLAGFAGVAGGSVSMATGEYVSVASQTEAIQAEIDVEKAELRNFPVAEEAELAAVYRARGLTAELAAEVARQLSADPEQVWRIHAREELGRRPGRPAVPVRRGRLVVPGLHCRGAGPVAAVLLRRADAGLVAHPDRRGAVRRGHGGCPTDHEVVAVRRDPPAAARRAGRGSVVRRRRAVRRGLLAGPRQAKLPRRASMSIV